MGTEREEELRQAYEQLQQMDDPIDQAAFLTEFLTGKQKTAGNVALVNAVAMNLSDEL